MRRATSVIAWLACVGARPSRGDWQPAAADAINPLGCIVTGLEHGGTTVTSELIMTASGWLGPFEAGFLTAALPAEFPKIWPFNDWARATDASSLGLNGSKWTALVGQRTHLDMYRYALRESPLLRKANTTRFVDKVPGYRENLEAVLRRAPGVPVVFVFKTRASAYASYVTHRHMDEGAFNRTWAAFMRRLDEVSTSASLSRRRPPNTG